MWSKRVTVRRAPPAVERAEPAANEKVDTGESKDEVVEARTKVMEKSQASMIHAIGGEMAEFVRDSGHSKSGDAQHHSRFPVLFWGKKGKTVERTKVK